jgi:hypothetical protein
MKVIVDGVEIKVQNDVRVVYDTELDGEPHTLQVVANHEGLIYDLFDEAEEVAATRYDFVDDIVENVVGHRG